MIEVVAAVVRRADRYLVARRPAHKQHGGLWEFPGGKRDAGESADDALRRELAEELGVSDASVGRVLATLANDAIVLHFLEATFDCEARPSEHSELRWCTAEELRGMPLCPLDRRFVASL
jgi:mutator protein MutT